MRISADSDLFYCSMSDCILIYLWIKTTCCAHFIRSFGPAFSVSILLCIPVLKEGNRIICLTLLKKRESENNSHLCLRVEGSIHRLKVSHTAHFIDRFKKELLKPRGQDAQMQRTADYTEGLQPKQTPPSSGVWRGWKLTRLLQRKAHIAQTPTAQQCCYLLQHWAASTGHRSTCAEYRHRLN